MDRRSLLKAAAWSAPVIAIAVAAPAAAASDTVCTNFAQSPVTQYDVAEVVIDGPGKQIIVTYKKDIDIIDVNVHTSAGNQNIHKAGVQAGHVEVIKILVCDPTFVQVHGNNTHYYGGGVFR